MAITTLKIVEGNTAPPFSITCQRNGTVIDLTGCTVNLIITNGLVQTNIGHTACTNSNPTTGVVIYTPQTGDFATAGSYTCDVAITYANLSVETIYDQLKITARLKVLSSS
jgi:hypothetical protein